MENRYTDIDVELSKQLADILRPETKACYQTSALGIYMLIESRRYDVTEVKYCEGVALIGNPGFATSHGWLQVFDKVVDAQWSDHLDGNVYVPVFSLSYNDLQDYGVYGSKTTLPLSDWQTASGNTSEFWKQYTESQRKEYLARINKLQLDLMTGS